MTAEEFRLRFSLHNPTPYPHREPSSRQHLTPAAVLIPIVPRGDDLYLLLTLRAAHLKHHAGQISFPGGRAEPEDPNLIATALRESEEEIGLQARYVEVIGRLDPYTTVSNFSVTPIVGLVDPAYQLKLCHDEVDAAFEAPLSYLIDPEHHHVHHMRRNGLHHPVYFIPWQGRNIWGATAAMIRHLGMHIGGRAES